MTEQKRQAILAACAFAKVFLDAADEELRGGSSERTTEAAAQLEAAICNMEESLQKGGSK